MVERKVRILEFMRQEAYKPLLFNELVMVLEVPKKDSEIFKSILQELEQEGKIFRTKRDRYGVPERMNLVVGRFEAKGQGYGFVIPDNEDIEDVFIPSSLVNGAMANDLVIARISKNLIGKKKCEGEIIKILKRANKRLVGTFEQSKYFGFVITDNKAIGDIFVAKDGFNGAQSGQKVVVEITKWSEKRRNAEGEIVEILGFKNDTGIDILSILKSYHLDEEFPENVLKEACEISDKVTDEMIRGRRDLRAQTMVTIDGEDAKDLDDAVSIEKLEDGKYRLGVHIADVSNYVKEGSPLDREALERGTSVYLVDRVIPMLPKKLSNGICSLNPKVDRLAFSVLMDIDFSGKVTNCQIFESVINISERMTYTDVYKILVKKDKELIDRYKYLLEDFNTMEELAKILYKKRKERGAIDFDFAEAKIILDEKGTPIEIKKYEITIANKIIEEFMLVCNETVAEHFYWRNAPFVYRIHEEPDFDKVESFNEFVKNLGYVLKGVNKLHPRSFQKLLELVKGKKEERIISTVMLRSMKKARYSHYSDIHFGLAAKYYCHFTSPIRRYPDLIIHRIMKEYLKENVSSNRENSLNERLPEIAKQCSERERAAEEAERETNDLKKVEFMKKHVGESFEGIISSITSFGMFVELDNTIEGLVKLGSMEDDYYIFNEKQYSLIGERTGKIFRIGDTIKVILAKADIVLRQIDFVIEEHIEGRGNGQKFLLKKGENKKRSKKI